MVDGPASTARADHVRGVCVIAGGSVIGHQGPVQVAVDVVVVGPQIDRAGQDPRLVVVDVHEDGSPVDVSDISTYDAPTSVGCSSTDASSDRWKVLTVAPSDTLTTE